MDSFEFAQITIVLIIGFAVSEILSDWGGRIRRRALRAAALQLVATAYILAYSVRFLWVQWWSRSIAWDYGSFLLLVGSAGLLALAAHVARAGSGDSPGTDPYVTSRRPVCILLAMLSAVSVGRFLWVPPFEGAVPLLLIGVHVAHLLGFAAMAVLEDPRLQWGGWTLHWALHVATVSQLARRLEP